MIATVNTVDQTAYHPPYPVASPYDYAHGCKCLQLYMSVKPNSAPIVSGNSPLRMQLHCRLQMTAIVTCPAHEAVRHTSVAIVHCEYDFAAVDVVQRLIICTVNAVANTVTQTVSAMSKLTTRHSQVAYDCHGKHRRSNRVPPSISGC